MEIDQQSLDRFVAKVPRRTRIMIVVTICSFVPMGIGALFLPIDPTVTILVTNGTLIGVAYLFNRRIRKLMAEGGEFQSNKQFAGSE